MNDDCRNEARCGVDQPPFDYESSLARADGDQGLLGEMAGLFIESCRELLRELESSLAAGDAARVYRASHALKGSAANFNASAVVGRAACLEAQGRTGNLGGAREVFDQLCRESDILLAALRPLASAAAAT